MRIAREDSIYPDACCRCGFCCLSEVCPAGLAVYGIKDKHSRCPALDFDGDDAVCLEVRNRFRKGIPVVVFGIGAGCCIKARAFKDGRQYDFASLPVGLKRMAARQLKEKRRLNHETKG